MARPLRIEYSGAIYHVMARGNGRQDMVCDDRDRQRLIDRLETTVGRYGWELFCYVLMTNHLHAFFQTPKPNLSRGMQYWLSGYANWWCKRHQFSGHVFQGRFKGELVEDETYFWSASRYIHLNPVRAGLVTGRLAVVQLRRLRPSAAARRMDRLRYGVACVARRIRWFGSGRSVSPVCGAGNRATSLLAI